MQKVGKFINYNDSLKYMQFLEETDIQPQAFLLIAEYCIAKQGESVSPSYLFNKAKKYIKNGWTTYEQIERALAIGAKKVQLFRGKYTPEMVAKAKENGIRCNIFWSDDPKEAVELIKSGIDCILTNDFLAIKTDVDNSL